MALMWKKLQPDIDVVCLMSSLEYQFVYSSRIKEVSRLGGNVTDLVPSNVAKHFTCNDTFGKSCNELQKKIRHAMPTLVLKYD